jgi:hypothetical protein
MRERVCTKKFLAFDPGAFMIASAQNRQVSNNRATRSSKMTILDRLKSFL